jgi:hypothetical protein
LEQIWKENVMTQDILRHHPTINLKRPLKNFSLNQGSLYHLTITELFKNALSTEEFLCIGEARKALTLGR